MKYAVIKIGGAQFKVSPGEEVAVDRCLLKEGEKISFDKVLLVGEDGKVKVGEPTVKGASVSARVVKQFLGKKLDVFRFKAKVGYRRKMGFRPQKTLLKIEEISA